jgi:hypothetical protein
MEVVTVAVVILAGATNPAHPGRHKMTSERPRAVSPLPKPLIKVLREMPMSTSSVWFGKKMVGGELIKN